MRYYLQVLEILKLYFGENECKRFFMEGGCFWLASFLSKRIPNSSLWINRYEEHCALAIDGELYDIRGKISKCDFHKASQREISFMKKNYIPKFDTRGLENYLSNIDI